jgi:hypothetical protein
LVNEVACRRVIGAFPWLGAIVAARALPCHSTVVPPGRRVSSSCPLSFSVLSWSLLGHAPPLRCTGVPPQACSRVVGLGLAVMCDFKLCDHSLSIKLAVRA